MKRFEKRNLFIGNKKPLLCKGFYYLSTESETDYLLIAGILQPLTGLEAGLFSCGDLDGFTCLRVAA